MFTNKTPWIILLLLWMGGSTWWHVCKIKQICGDDAPQSSSAADAVSVPVLSIVDGDRLNLTIPGTFGYAKSGFTESSAGLGNTLQTLADYLKANPTRSLAITGHYLTDEQNASAYPNLGVARAENLKAELVKLGVPASQLTTNGLLAGDANSSGTMTYNAAGDSLYGGLTFAFTGEAAPAPAPVVAAEPEPAAEAGPLPKTEEALAEAQKFTTVFKPIDLYFKLGKSTYIETADTRAFFAEATTYLKANKDKKLLLTGYTDNKGPAAANRQLSRARAEAVRSRLITAGIDAGQVVVSAKGELEPKASNATLAGRKANRRVTAVVE